LEESTFGIRGGRPRIPSAPQDGRISLKRRKRDTKCILAVKRRKKKAFKKRKGGGEKRGGPNEVDGNWWGGGGGVVGFGGLVWGVCFWGGGGWVVGGFLFVWGEHLGGLEKEGEPGFVQRARFWTGGEEIPKGKKLRTREDFVISRRGIAKKGGERRRIASAGPGGDQKGEGGNWKKGTFAWERTLRLEPRIPLFSEGEDLARSDLLFTLALFGGGGGGPKRKKKRIKTLRRTRIRKAGMPRRRI